MATEFQAAMAKLAADTKRACATSADVVKAAHAQTAAKAAATGGSKAAVFTHPVLIVAAGGAIVGVVAYHLAHKYWLNKKDDTVES